MQTRRIREAVDIVQVIGRHVALKRAGASFKGLCPFHEEKTPSFNVHPARQTYKCFGCGAGGDVFTFIQQKEKVSFVEARRMLAELAGITLAEDSGPGGGGPSKRDLAQANEWAQRVFLRHYRSELGESARRYVAGRGISPEMAEAFGIGLAVDSYDDLIRGGRQAKVDIQLLVAAGLVKERSGGGHYDTFRNRLMFPIKDVTGRIVGFGGRTLGEDPAKYLNTPATLLFDKSTHLFGLEQARDGISAAGRVIVVEGYTDCLMAHQYGFNETVATLGTAMTDAHASVLRRYTDRVVLLFDSDEAGQRAADRALSVSLMSGLDVTLARVPEGKDPCEYLLSGGKSGFDAVLIGAVPALEFKWRQVAGAFDASDTGPGRRRAIEAYLEQLSAWVGRGAIDPIQKGLLVAQVSRILGIPAEDLHGQLQRMQSRSASLTRPTSEERGSAVRRDGIVERSINAEQQALRQTVEALLNEPVHYRAVAAVFDPSAIQDEPLAAVAGTLVEMLENGGERDFRVDELIGRLESPEFGQLVTDLQVSGERRGGYAEVIASAMERLEAVARFRRTARLAEEIRRQRGQPAGEGQAAAAAPTGEDERLLALGASAKQPHFAAARARRRYL